jgi:hypothetical protein
MMIMGNDIFIDMGRSATNVPLDSAPPDSVPSDPGHA